MSNNPPLFKNFGKSFSDLLEKKFEFDRDIKVKTSTLSGLTFETTGRASSKSSDYSGLFKGTYKRTDFGSFEANLNTDGKTKFIVEADKLRTGLVLKLTAEQDPQLSSNFDAAYSREHLTVSTGVTATKDQHFVVDESAAVGVDGLSVGGAVKYNLTTSSLVGYDVGTQYAQPDFTVALKTADKTDRVTASYIHNVNPDVTVGASFSYDSGSKNPGTLLSLASSYALDRDTLAKVKFTSAGVLTTAWEQRLYNPKLKFGLSAEYGLKNQSATPQQFGFNVVFGDN